MDEREKLVELFHEHNSHYVVFCDDCFKDTPEEFNSRMYGLADHLISSGVTVQEWIPVEDRLPEKSGEYLTYCGDYDGVCVLYYEVLKTKGKWRTRWKEVTHWMPLPSAPKGE